MPTKFENLETLRAAAWASFATRREFAWKVSLAFWSLLVAFIAGIASDKFSLTCQARILLTFFPFSLGFAHLIWIWGIRRGDLIDRKEEGYYRDAMRREIDFKEDESLTKDRDKVFTGVMKHWNAVAQALTTIALSLLAIISIWIVQPSTDQVSAIKCVGKTIETTYQVGIQRGAGTVRGPNSAHRDSSTSLPLNSPARLAALSAGFSKPAMLQQFPNMHVQYLRNSFYGCQSDARAATVSRDTPKDTSWGRGQNIPPVAAS